MLLNINELGDFPTVTELLSGKEGKTIVLDLTEIALLITEKIGELFIDNSSGMYLGNSLVNIMDAPNTKNIRVINGKYSYVLIAKNGFTADVIENKKIISSKPKIKTSVIKFLALYMASFIDKANRDLYLKECLKTEIVTEIPDSMFPRITRIPTDQRNQNFEFVRDTVEDYLSQYNCISSLSDFIGSDFFHIYTLDIINTVIRFNKIVDYRIYVWTLERELKKKKLKKINPLTYLLQNYGTEES